MNIRNELDLGRARWGSIRKNFPLAFDEGDLLARGSFVNQIFLTTLGKLPEPVAPATRILDRMSRERKILPADRFLELHEKLWEVEERKAIELQALVRRQEALLETDSGRLDCDVEAWILGRKDAFVIRKGDDEVHSRLIAEYNDHFVEKARLVQEYLDRYGE